MIGGVLAKGVSGGEWKRTSIGVELITDPYLLFLDEPTTGLDSFTASHIMEVIKNMAMQGRTIITTIHQPNTEIFNMFDKLMLLASGWVMYFNEASKSAAYFESIGYPVPDQMNPADHYLSITNIDALEEDMINESFQSDFVPRDDLELKYEQWIQSMHQSYLDSDLVCDVDEKLQRLLSIVEQPDAKIYSWNWLMQYLIISQRAFRNNIRSPDAGAVWYIGTILIVILLMLTFQ